MSIPARATADERLRRIESVTDAALAHLDLEDLLARKQLIMGFGHRVYTTSDPRSDVIKQWSRRLAFRATPE